MSTKIFWIVITLLWAILMVSAVLSARPANAQWYDDSAPNELPEIWLGEVTDDAIQIMWANQLTYAQKTIQEFKFETRHGLVILELERTNNKYACGETFCELPEEEQADIIRVTYTPDGWVSEIGYMISMPERSHGSFRIIPWSGM